MSLTLYNATEIEALLRDLQPLQDQIENASQTFLVLGEKGFQKKLVQDWKETFNYYSNLENFQKRIALLYLVNDIIQKCKSKVPGFLDGFREALLGAFKLMVQIKDERNIPSVIRLVELWRERRVYSKEHAKEMLDVLTEPPAENQAEKEALNIPEGLIPVPQELTAFLDALKELRKWKVKTAEEEGKLTTILRGSEFNEEEAQNVLGDLRKSVQFEQKYRTNILKADMEMMRQLDTDHTNNTHNLKRIGGLIDDIESILFDRELIE